MKDVNRWKCTVCGYIHEGDAPPQVCPLCDVGPELFVLENRQGHDARLWKCEVCNHIVEGSEVPLQCSVCGALSQHFKPHYHKQVVIIGSGIGALSAAKAIRSEDQTIGITLLTEEAVLPYYRINLCKYLGGEVDQEALQINSNDWYEVEHIRYVLKAKIVDVRADAKQVILKDGRIIPYDVLVLATGATSFIPPLPGGEHAKVVGIRTLEDVETVKAYSQAYEACTCIGGGLLGLETASAMVKLGLDVTVYEVAPWLMPRQLNQKASEYVTRHMKMLGMKVEVGAQIPDLSGELVLVTAGIRPRVELAKQMGVAVNRGIIVNRHMETSIKDVYAVGDAVEVEGNLYGLWPVAMNQGEVAGRHIARQEATFGEATQSSFLKVLGIDVFSIGDYTQEGLVDYEWGDEHQYCYFGMKEGRIVASIVIGDYPLAARTKQWIDEKRKWDGEAPKDAYHLLTQVNKPEQV